MTNKMLKSLLIKTMFSFDCFKSVIPKVGKIALGGENQTEGGEKNNIGGRSY